MTDGRGYKIGRLSQARALRHASFHRARRFLLTSFLLVAAGVTCPAAAAGDKIYTLSLPAGTLAETLYQISRLTGLQVAFADPAARDILVPAISGGMTRRELLAAACANPRIRCRFISNDTVLVSVVKAPRPIVPLSPEWTPLRIGESNIIVTASRREEYQSQLPMSVASYTQDMLDVHGLEDMHDIARLTPAVLLRHAWGGSTNLSVRGIYSNSGSATTGVYIDDTPIQTRSLGAGVTSTNVYPALFDLERVEVLRGPQGALFGSGSLGGTIRFLTREPDFQNYSGQASFELSDTRYGGFSHEVSGAVGGPIVHDRLAFRLAVFDQDRAGWIDRVEYPSGQILDRGSNAVATRAIRSALRLRVGEQVEIVPSFYYQETRDRDAHSFWSLLSDPAAGVFRSGAPLGQPASDRFLLSSLRVRADLPGFSLLSATSYFRRRRPSVVDYTNFMVEVLTRGARFTLDEVPDYRVPVTFHNDQDVFTQEFRLTSDDVGATRWILGAFFQRAGQEAEEYIEEPLLNEALGVLVGQDALSYFGSDLLPNGISYIGIDHSKDTQVALFGQVDQDIRPDLTLTLGGRLAWTHFSQTNFQDGPQSGGQLQSRIRHGEVPILPRIGLTWRPSPDIMAYLTVAKGSRIGGANAQVSPLRCGAQLARFGYETVPERFTSDRIWNYELGTKSRFLGGALSVEAAIFRFDWKNVQQSFSLRCLFRYTGNSPAARGYGGELSLGIAPFDSLSVNLTGSYTRSRYISATYGGIIDDETGERALVSAAGQRLPAPAIRVNAFLRYLFPLGKTVTGWLGVSGEYASSYSVGNAPGTLSYDPIAYKSPATREVALRAGIRKGAMEASLFIENLLNSDAALQISHSFLASANTRFVTLRPRTIGVRLSYSFP